MLSELRSLFTTFFTKINPTTLKIIELTRIRGKINTKHRRSRFFLEKKLNYKIVGNQGYLQKNFIFLFLSRDSGIALKFNIVYSCYFSHNYV